jgi:hypothetical protein
VPRVPSPNRPARAARCAGRALAFIGRGAILLVALIAALEVVLGVLETMLGVLLMTSRGIVSEWGLSVTAVGVLVGVPAALLLYFRSHDSAG